MKKLLVVILLSIFLTLWAFGLILPDAGYVLVLLGHKSVESSLWFVCFAIVACVVIWWLLKKFVLVGWSLARSITDFLVFGSTERASKRAASGLIDYFSGDWLQARKKLLRTAVKVESPLVNYLAAANCSFELGDREEAFKILSDAQKKYPKSTVAIGLVQVKFEISLGRLDQAKHILIGLQQKAPKHPLVLLELSKVYRLRNEWSALTELLPFVKKYKLPFAADVSELETALVCAQLEQEGEIAAGALPADRAHMLRKVWARLSSSLQKNPRIVASYVKVLLANGEDQDAETILRKTLSKTWDDKLIDLYGLLRVTDIAETIRTAENWLKYYPQNPHLLRALGRLSLRNHLWGLARDYFQRSLVVEKSPETYAELARLLRSLGDVSKSLEAYHAALQLSTPPLPELPQPSKGY